MIYEQPSYLVPISKYLHYYCTYSTKKKYCLLSYSFMLKVNSKKKKNA